ncbi:kunitz type trypsin inhibitor 104 [Ziziphus jujuba]|uniref:Kunitz type trypsin inhibitor 104 n=2 Tax=Ziziphus jujuba TaxID=326968 RepID=A0ABM3I738_ZIZJJ|nr:kunitz type trypsin inhibitor 104 [Ziziphus jujuba]KAH7512713.1 hypothetical protein FEM48_Zijuj12G0119800 [Ziziphus jujuba var. spinosa]
MKLIIRSLSLIWLVMAVAVTAQEDSPAPVLDTSGQPLERGVEYYINPAITDNGGRFTLIARNNSCPLYAGQENVSGPEGIPVTFAPFEEGENVVRETKNFKVTFSALSTCVQSTAWKVGEQEPETKRRLIVTGNDGSYSNYFYIGKEQVGGNVYRIVWCPAELCPTCRFACGNVGALVENGKRLLALDGSVLPVVFERA